MLTALQWTQQESSITPSCRYAPSNAQDVSRAVAFLAHSNCHFAIRGGGHMSWAGAANIQDGVTIDLSAMNSVSVSRDNYTTSVGSGARWQDVYLRLDELNLAVSGGRVNDVGVAGLTLGGKSRTQLTSILCPLKTIRRKFILCCSLRLRLR